jgi:disulfide bond formation protein DsbB
MEETTIQKFNLTLKIFNIIDVVGISIILLIAFGMQFWFNELPCPLCLLQRVGLIGIAFGFILNMRFKPHPTHYSLSLLSALLTSFIALRQILLHIVSGSGVYGNSVLGLHLYTWTFILCMIIIVYISISMGFFLQYKSDYDFSNKLKPLVNIAFILILAISLLNIVSTYLVCGFGACPDNPIHYSFWHVG